MRAAHFAASEQLAGNADGQGHFVRPLWAEQRTQDCGGDEPQRASGSGNREGDGRPPQGERSRRPAPRRGPMRDAGRPAVARCACARAVAEAARAMTADRQALRVAGRDRRAHTQKPFLRGSFLRVFLGIPSQRLKLSSQVSRCASLPSPVCRVARSTPRRTPRSPGPPHTPRTEVPRT